MSTTPQNFQYNSSSHILSWDPVPDTYEYWIEYTPSGVVDWKCIYTGALNSCDFNVDPGQYLVKGRRKKLPHEPWDPFGTVETISV